MANVCVPESGTGIAMDIDEINVRLSQLQSKIDTLNASFKKVNEFCDDISEFNNEGDLKDISDDFTESVKKYLNLCNQYYQTQKNIILKISNQFSEVDETILSGEVD